MVYDDVFRVTGSFGPYQKRLYILQSLPVVFTAVQTCLSVFILFAPDHRCQPQNDFMDIQDTGNKYTVNQSVSPDIRIYSSIGEGIRYSRCEVIYHYSNSTPGGSTPDNATMYSSECRRWVFDTSEFDNTFVTQEKLVCGKKLHRTHATMAYMLGFTFGSLGIGILSDKFGRKPALLISIFTHAVSNIILTWMTDFWVFSILRFVSGVSVGGLLSTAYVMDLEIVGPGKKMIAGTVFQLFWGVGMLILVGAAYLLRDWRHLNLAMTVPTFLFLTYIWLIPESPRWLAVRGRIEEAETILRQITIKNNRPCPERILSDNILRAPAANHDSLSHVCSLKLVMQTIVICINWLVVACVFSGLSLNVSNLGGDVYLNFLLTSIAEIAGFLICMPLLYWLGRKPVYIASLLTGGIALVLTIFPFLYATPDLHWVTVLLSLLGKVGSSSAFSTVFLYSAEFFPTTIRNSALGVANFSARVGGMIAPYIVDLGMIVGSDMGRVLPMAVFGIAAVVASLLSLMLTETKFRRFPDQMGDFENPPEFDQELTVIEPLNNPPANGNVVM
ncbi:organic cation transporter protein-like [Crassostrea virginica]